jgi:hypothetical protein
MSAQAPQAGPSGHLVPDAIARRVSAARRAEAEVDRLTTLLHDLPGFRADPSASSPHVRALAARRAELLKAFPRPRPTRSLADQPIDAAILHIGDLLWPWSVLNLPYMYEGIDETPGTDGTGGEIATAGLFAGGLGYGGMPTDDGTRDPYTEKWWIHNWRNSAVFPAAPFTGRLYYRFGVDSECHIYRAPVYSGSVMEFVTIGWTADVASNPLDDWNTWETVGWPVNTVLPSAELNYAGSVPVSGSIDVTQGKSAALGFIYGTIVSVATGYVQFLWGNFGTRRYLAPGQVASYTDYDKIEYRFEPEWWIKAVAQRLDARALIGGA